MSVLVLALAGGAWAVWSTRGGAARIAPSTIFAVERDTLRISVRESGQLKAVVSEDVHCELRGSATILELIPEGTHVMPGDLLVKLDISKVEDELTAQQINFEQALAAHVQATEAKAIQESMNESNIAAANLTVLLAITDLEKFKEGDMKLERDKAKSQIKLNEMDAKTREKTFKETGELVKLEFAAKTELERDQLAFERAQNEFRISELEQDLQEKYDFPRQLQVLTADRVETEAELERVERRARAELAEKVANLRSKKATLDLEQEKLDRLNFQIKNAEIYAKSEGMVVYPVNSRGRMFGSDRDRIEEGATVRERQLIISLPDTSQMRAQFNVHESSLDKVKEGLPAVITIEALPDQAFVGKVTFIAPLPDSGSRYLNPDLKVYRCDVTLAGETEHLRPGMSASCEIICEEIEDVLLAPLRAVHRRGKHFYVYAYVGGGPSIREVQIGPHNDKVVAINKGLSEGERIYLSVPSGAPTPDWPDVDDTGVESVESLRQQVQGIEARSEAGLAWASRTR